MLMANEVSGFFLPSPKGKPLACRGHWNCLPCLCVQHRIPAIKCFLSGCANLSPDCGHSCIFHRQTSIRATRCAVKSLSRSSSAVITSSEVRTYFRCLISPVWLCGLPHPASKLLDYKRLSLHPSFLPDFGRYTLWGYASMRFCHDNFHTTEFCSVAISAPMVVYPTA